MDSVADKTEGERSQLFLFITLMTPNLWLLSISRIDLQLSVLQFNSILTPATRLQR